MRTAAAAAGASATMSPRSGLPFFLIPAATAAKRKPATRGTGASGASSIDMATTLARARASCRAGPWPPRYSFDASASTFPATDPVPPAADAWWRTSSPDTMNTTISAMFVAWSATRSRYFAHEA